MFVVAIARASLVWACGVMGRLEQMDIFCGATTFLFGLFGLRIMGRVLVNFIARADASAKLTEKLDKKFLRLDLP